MRPTFSSVSNYAVSPKSLPAEVLRALSQVFEAEGARWYVFGAQAALAYGNPRLTTDIDVTVEFPLEKVEKLIQALQRAGFGSRVESLTEQVERTRVLPMVHQASGFPVDLVIAGPGLEAEFLDAARRLDLGGVEVPVIAPADLLVTKILAGRSKDLADVEGVLRERGKTLDLDRTRRLLGLLEEALARRDLLSELERIIDRLKGD